MGASLRNKPAALFLLAGTILLIIGLLAGCRRGPAPATATAQIAANPSASATLPPPTGTHTVPPPPSPTPTSTRMPRPTGTGTATPMPLPTVTVTPTIERVERERFGVAASMNHVDEAYALGLPFGSYMDWRLAAEPDRPGGVTYIQTIRLKEWGVVTPWSEIEAVLAAQPGALWLVGNEPDVIHQDNVTPGRYAELYHQVYTFLKERDPTAQVAIGGVSQPTPLRRAYLDVVLDTYAETYGEPLPVDVWNVHGFVLREERGSWGVDIPPGMNDDLAIQYEIEDHDDLAIFEANLVAFRGWMAERGYQDWPLIVSEYGLVMPEDFGFPAENVAAYMTGTFDFFRTARNETGYPADENRLVQGWIWFMLYVSDDGLRTSNLYDRPNDTLTPLGEVFADYVFTYSFVQE